MPASSRSQVFVGYLDPKISWWSVGVLAATLRGEMDPRFGNAH